MRCREKTDWPRLFTPPDGLGLISKKPGFCFSIGGKNSCQERGPLKWKALPHVSPVTLNSAMVEFTRGLFGHVSKEAIVRTTFALIDVPYASVRRSLLAGKSPSPVVDELVAETYMALLGRLS